MDCPICYENKENIVMFQCSHYICTECLNSLINTELNLTCPCCREPIVNSYDINGNSFINHYPKKLPLRIQSEKGKSEPILNEEEQLLKLIFGNYTRIEQEEYPHLMNRTILIQSYKDNCWYIGYFSSFLNSDTNRKIRLNDCKYISRCDGKVYNTTPAVRDLKIYDKDSIFYV